MVIKKLDSKTMDINSMDKKDMNEDSDDEDRAEMLSKHIMCGRCRPCRRSCPTVCYVPKRFIVTILTGIGMMLVYAMRTNLAVTVILILDFAPHTKVGTTQAMEAVWHVSTTPSNITLEKVLSADQFVM